MNGGSLEAFFKILVKSAVTQISSGTKITLENPLLGSKRQPPWISTSLSSG